MCYNKLPGVGPQWQGTVILRHIRHFKNLFFCSYWIKKKPRKTPQQFLNNQRTLEEGRMLQEQSL